MHACIHACTHVCMHTWKHAYPPTNLHSFIHTYINTFPPQFAWLIAGEMSSPFLNIRWYLINTGRGASPAMDKATA